MAPRVGDPQAGNPTPCHCRPYTFISLLLDEVLFPLLRFLPVLPSGFPISGQATAAVQKRPDIAFLPQLHRPGTLNV